MILPEGGRVGFVVPAHLFSFATTVEKWRRVWSVAMLVDMSILEPGAGLWRISRLSCSNRNERLIVAYLVII